MFFEDLDDARKLAEKTNFSIFAFSDFSVLPDFYQLFPKTTLFLKPDEKTNKISVEAVRDFTSLSSSKETIKRFFIVEQAETMNEAAENAFLKNLEEPNENSFFILIVKNLSALLPTVRSRANIYIQKTKNNLNSSVEADEKVKALAKSLIVARPSELIEIANEVSKKKDNTRAFALSVVGAAIEIVYKSFFATGNEKFIKKLPNLLDLYSNIESNGHIKLHFVADML